VPSSGRILNFYVPCIQAPVVHLVTLVTVWHGSRIQPCALWELYPQTFWELFVFLTVPFLDNNNITEFMSVTSEIFLFLYWRFASLVNWNWNVFYFQGTLKPRRKWHEHIAADHYSGSFYGVCNKMSILYGFTLQYDEVNTVQILRILSFVMQRCVVRWNDVSEQHLRELCFPSAFTLVSCSAYSSIMKLELVSFFETSVNIQ
jgi:hypothetical protein